MITRKTRPWRQWTPSTAACSKNKAARVNVTANCCKRLIVVDTKRQVMLAQETCSGPYGSAMLRPLAAAAHDVNPLGVFLADVKFDSEHNHRRLRRQLMVSSVIQAKRGKATWQVQGYRAQIQAAFLNHLYRQRALVESVFSAVKRKLSAQAPG